MQAKIFKLTWRSLRCLSRVVISLLMCKSHDERATKYELKMLLFSDIESIQGCDKEERMKLDETDGNDAYPVATYTWLENQRMRKFSSKIVNF